MTQPSHKQDIIIIVLCGLVVGLLIFLLSEKQQQLNTWNNFMNDYTQVAQVVHMPEKYDGQDDSMQGVVIDELLASRLDYTQGEMKEYQDDLRANLLLLTKDFAGAREQLGIKKTADDRYDQATVDVLEAWNLSAATGLNDLTHAYTLVEQSIQGFQTAALLSPQEALSAKIDHNHGLAENLSWVLGVQLVFVRFEAMFTDVTKVAYSLDVLGRLLDEVLSLLDRREPTDSLLVTCKEELGEYILLAKHDVLTSQDIISTYENALTTLFGTCVRDINQCVVFSETVYTAFSVVLGEVSDKLRDYSATFYDLDELFLQGYDGPLISFCSSLASVEEGDGSSLSSLLLELADTADEQGTKQEDGQEIDEESATESFHEPLEAEWASYLIDEIRQTQQEWLEQKTTLEQEPGYSPHDLLDAMFQQFKGNDTGFKRDE